MSSKKFEFVIIILISIIAFLIYKTYFPNKIQEQEKNHIIKALDKIQKSNSLQYASYKNKKRLSIAEDMAEISGILDQKHIETKHINDQNSTAQELNYIFNKNHKNTFIKESIQNEYTINSLVSDINNKEYKDYDTKKLSKTLEKKHIYVLLGHFKDHEAIKLTQYLEYQGFNTLLKIIDSKYHFVLAKFETIKSANEFRIWAINQGFFDAKIIKN